MNNLQVGFSRVNVTPPLGINMSGYYLERHADGVLDELEVNAVAFSDGKNKTVMLCVDNAGIIQAIMDKYRLKIAEQTGLDENAIFISCTHTHTGPSVRIEHATSITHKSEKKLADSGEYNCNFEGIIEEEYRKYLAVKLVDGAKMALADLKPAKMGYAVGKAPNIGFIRLFKMKDGTVATNPGPFNPNIDHAIGEVDERVNVIRFDRENAESVAILSFGDHPDTIGGTKLSADWPGFTRRIFERAVGNVKCVVFNGAEGDVNHVNVHPVGGYNNDMTLDFDDVMRGYGHARHMGNVVAGGAMQVYDKVEYIDANDIAFLQKVIRVPSNMPSKEELPLAHKYVELHKAGKDDEIPFKGMYLTTAIAEAERMVDLENGPEFFDMRMSCLRVGGIAFVGIPGEPFTGIGVSLKETEGYSLVTPLCITNGYEGYFPTLEAYKAGGYEARSSIFKEGVAELIIKEGKELLSQNLSR